MLIRLIRKYTNSDEMFSDYELVDVLRALSVQNSQSVITRAWLVQGLVFSAYNDDFESDRLQFLIPELELIQGQKHALVNGERLLERSALIHMLEEGFFLRVADTQSEVTVDAEYRLHRGPAHFQATNVDLEIRCNEAPYEVITKDIDIIAHLQYSFAKTEIEP